MRFRGFSIFFLVMMGISAPAIAQNPSNEIPSQVPPTVPRTQPQGDPIERVVAAGWMTRAANGNFHSDRILSRAELASILVKAFQLDTRKPPKTIAPAALQDVPPSHWAYNSIQTVLRHGVMTGYREGRFFPDQRVTRAEAFSIFAQSYGVFQFPEETVTAILTKYPDAKEVPSWARKSLATALYEGFINTEPANQIRPLQPMTRGDMAYALSKYLDIQGQTTGFLQGR